MQNLRPAGYQLVALTKLLLNGQNAILIADGVGVGKTIVAGYILSCLVNDGSPALVVCPPGLLEKWRFELRTKFALAPVLVRTPEELANAEEAWSHSVQESWVYVVASSLLSRMPAPAFPGTVVIDEIHSYRNPSTALWQSARALLSKASYRIGLSATPINNRLEDLAAELALLLKVEIAVADALIADLWRPGQRELLSPLLTRFNKERLGIHFARRLVSDIRIQYPASYIHEALTLIKEKKNRSKNEAVYLDEITYFRLAASSPVALGKSLDVDIQGPSTKRDELLKLLGRHDLDHVIVFCEFEATASELASVINDRPSFLITGSVPVFDRQNLLVQFSRSQNGIMVMTAVGSEGLDLQFCSVLVNYDLTWNPMVLEQRIGRIDRIGQSKDIIQIYNFIVDGSIDERILEVLGMKLGLVRGSVLETAPVLSDKQPLPLPEQIGTNDFLSQEILKKELSEARGLLKAIALSSEIIPEDYSVLPYVDEEFCNPVRLREARKGDRPVWLREGAELGKWLNALSSESKRLGERISYYAS